MEQLVEILKQRAIESMDLGFEEGLVLARHGLEKPFVLMAAAAEIREYFKGKRINLCGIINAKSGLCPENCAFCAQSAHYSTGAPEYPFIGKETIIEGAQQAKAAGAHMFGIITSGTRVESEAEWDEIYGAVKEINKLGVKSCASLGMLDVDRGRKLKEAGLFRYHHNLETARSYFDTICTTHAYQEDIDTVTRRMRLRNLL